MGYTITMRVKDKKLRAKALAFMNKQFKDWGVLYPKSGSSMAVRGPLGGKDLSYDRKSASIGFDYSCLNDPERQYVWCVIRWMALTFGDHCKFRGSSREIPFYVYDGHEKTAVLVGKDWKEKKDVSARQTFPDGWADWLYKSRSLSQWRCFCLLMRDYQITPRVAEKVIRAELARLTAEWQKVK